jgi:hypothetical protein
VITSGLVLAAGGYGIYRFIKHRQAAPSKEGSTALPACEMGPSYPGFIQAEDGTCQPSGTTPPGIYVDAACQDFVFVSGDEGPQHDLIEKIMAAARIVSVQPQGQSADPVVIVTAFLHATWPNCAWPPAADGPERLVQMFEALCFIVGRKVVADGGRVLGTKDEDLVDERVRDRLAELGLPPFDPSVVPEIDLGKPLDFAGPPPPPIAHGVSQVPSSGIVPGLFEVPTPPMQGVSGALLPACATVDPYERAKTVDLFALWSLQQPKIYEIKVLEFTGDWEKCHDYELTIGACLRAKSARPYGLLSDYIADPTMDFNVGEVRLQNTQQQPVIWDQFRAPAWKQQIQVRIKLILGQVEIQPVYDITGSNAGDAIDPCSNLVRRWPIPANVVFDVMAWNGQWALWQAVPVISIVKKDNAVYLRLEYRGLPAFQWNDGGHEARAILAPTDLRFSVHSIARGVPT